MVQTSIVVMDAHTTKTKDVKKCPLCKTLYGFDVELEELWIDERKVYQCKNKNIKHQFCEHILVATRKNMAEFSCQDCSSAIDECDCYDCFVFCGQCNSFLFVACSDVIQMMDINEGRI